MTIKISQHFNHVPVQEQIEDKQIMDAVLADMAMLKAAFDALVAKVNTDFAAQNAAVTASQLDVDYAASIALTLES